VLSNTTSIVVENWVKYNGLPSTDQVYMLNKKVGDALIDPPKTCSNEEQVYRKNIKIGEQISEKIEASVIYKLMPCVTIYAIANCEFDVKKYIINEIAPPLMKTSSCASGMGFLPLNQIFWSNKIADLIEKNGETITQKILEIISAFRKLGINPMDRNSKGETSLDSYKEGVNAGRSPWSTEIVTALQYGDFTALIRELINKISPKMSNRLRLSFKYVIMHGLDDLCRGLIVSLLSSYIFAKKDGVHERVTNFLDMTLEFLKVRVDEKVDDDYEYSEDMVKKFLTAIVSNSQLILTEERKVDITGLSQWSIDVIGGIVAEISVLLKNPSIFTTFFESQYSIIESDSDKDAKTESGSQILTLMAHLIHRLCSSNNSNSSNKKLKIEQFLTIEICHNMQSLAINKQISPRVRMLIEGRITYYLKNSTKKRGKTLKSVDLTNVCILFHSSSEIENFEIKKNQTDQTDRLDGMDDDEDNDLACHRIQDIIDLEFEPKFNACGVPKFVQIVSSSYVTGQGYRILADALYNGTSTGFPAFTKMNNDKLRKMVICNIVYNVTNDIKQFSPTNEEIDNIKNAIEGINHLLKSHCGADIVMDALSEFVTDLLMLDDESMSYMWDNPNGKNNFGLFCDSFGIKSF
jgi:hypothetical protein